MTKVKEFDNKVSSQVITYSPSGKHLLVGNYKDVLNLYDVEKDSSVALIWSGQART